MQKIYQDLFERRNSNNVEKKQAHEHSAQSVQDLQSSLAQALVASIGPHLSCPSMNKGQTPILTGFDWAMSSDIGRINDAQLEMAIANSYRCEDIADQVVESTRFKYMLKQTRLVGGAFLATKEGKIGGKNDFDSICFIVLQI